MLIGFDSAHCATIGHVDRHDLVGEQPGLLRGVVAIVGAKASAEEKAAFGTWLVAAAQAAADAAKDGGFMGFHAVQVSEREQAMIDKVKAAVTA